MYKLQDQVEVSGIISGEDIINIESLISLDLFEYAGLKLPEFRLTLSSPATNASVIKPKETITFYLSSGSGAATGVYNFDILRADEIGSDHVINVYGLIKCLGFYEVNKSAFYEGNSSSVIEEVVSPYFKYVSNVASTNDYQRWYQHNISDRDFIARTWRNSYIPNSFIMTGIDRESNFNYISYEEQTKEENIKLLYDGTPNSFNLSIDDFAQVDNSFLNSIGQTDSETSASVGLDSLYPVQISNSGQAEFFSSNCHSNYAVARINNRNNLRTQSSHKILINQIGLSKFKLLDSIRINAKNEAGQFPKNYIVDSTRTSVKQDQVISYLNLTSS